MKKYSLSECKELLIKNKQGIKDAAASVGRSVKIYYHWSAGHYGQFFTYQFQIDKDGSIYSNGDLLSVLSETYKRNTGSISIGLLCAVGATFPNHLGEEPPTDAQIESCAALSAAISTVWELPLTIQNFMTHAEAADNMDGYNASDKYGPNSGQCERWDLWVLKPTDKPGSGGDTLRGKAIWYVQNP